MPRYIVPLCLAVAFLVAGCGGDSGVARSAHDMLQQDLEAALADLKTTQDERDTAEAEVARLTVQLADAEAEVESLTAEIGRAADAADVDGSLHAQLNAASANVTTLTTALAEARAQVTALTAQLTTAQTEATTLRGQLATTQASVTAAQQQAAQAQQEAAEQIAEAQQEASQQIEQANVDVRAPRLRTVLVGVTAASETEANVEWPRSGTLQFNVGAYTPGSVAPAAPGSWPRRASFAGQSGSTVVNAANDTAFLYSNIQGPGGSRAIWKVHGFGPVEMTDDLEMRARGTSAVPRGADNRQVGSGVAYTKLTINGSLGGVSGTFTCATCDGTVGDSTTGIDSHVTFPRGLPPDFGTVGSWAFSFPLSSHNARYQINDDDAYLYFGIWISETVDAAGTPGFQYIAGGGAESGSTLGNFNALTGTATFSGGAVGRYATIGQVGQQNASIGTFTATAAFTANFGDGTATGTLHGQLTDFREGGTALTGWRLTLGATANAATPTTIAAAAASGTTVGTIGGLAVNGNWGADFYGHDNMAPAPTGETPNRILYPVTRYPVADLAGVTGWFRASNDDAALAGAFGAACATGPCAR